MKRIAITIGDPGGVGPEVALKAVLSAEVLRICNPVLIGDRAVIEEAAKLAREGRKGVKPAGHGLPDNIEVIYVQGSTRGFVKRRPTASGGRACVGYIRKAVELAMDGRVDALVTAPISKEALRLGGFPWPGHTEMLAEFTATEQYAMMLVGGPLRVVLVTIHAALKKVPSLVTKVNVLKTIRLAKRACDMLGIREPRIAVAGLNPHAGESGILGNEEREAISPAVASAKEEGIPAEGPYPPDVIFHKAYKGEVDMVVCMYHDQGLIPLKMIAFDRGVNVTIGLPIIRTSPDHGTAYDIAWKGVANPSSMIEAIRMAVRLRL